MSNLDYHHSQLATLSGPESSVGQLHGPSGSPQISSANDLQYTVSVNAMPPVAEAVSRSSLTFNVGD